MGEEIKIPSKEEIKHLPLLAQVAFAARCARRVQPLYAHLWPKAKPEHIDAIEKAISTAELTASGKTVPAYISYSREAVATADARAAMALAADALAYDTHGRAISRAASAARAANAAACAAKACANVDIENVDSDAIGAIDAAVYAANYPSKPSLLQFAEEMRNDYDKLLKVTSSNTWKKRTPVPLSFWGSLWPNGAPENWPTEDIWYTNNGNSELRQIDYYEQPPLEIYIDPGSASKETVEAVFNALSELHRTHGGIGLDFVQEMNNIYEIQGVANDIL